MEKVSSLLIHKIFGVFLRLRDFARWFPKRFLRLFTHLFHGLVPGKYDWWPPNQRPSFFIRIAFWWIELLLLVIDLIGIVEVYEILVDLIKFKTRPLNDQEKEWAQSVFGNQLTYYRIRLDASAFVGPSWARMAYVSGFQVNFWRRIAPAILIHELMHIWQYEKVGLVYISRALWAQYSKEGYDYGGPERIWAAMQDGQSLAAFNYEQQAEVIADYFRLLQDQTPEYHYGLEPQVGLYAGLVRGSLNVDAA